MPNFSETKILPHKAREIYDLVMDIERYPEFLPWCKQAKVVEHVSAQNLTADLLISFKNFFEKYRSDVQYKETSPDAYFIETRAISGPFKSLYSIWKINGLDDGKSCRIEFSIEFQFNSFFLEKMIGPIFEKATVKMMKSFEERARALSL